MGARGLFFFFNDTATTEIYTLSLHDALPISCAGDDGCEGAGVAGWALAAGAVKAEGDDDGVTGARAGCAAPDRKSTRLNSSHGYISYAVFCLKNKTLRPT